MLPVADDLVTINTTPPDEGPNVLAAHLHRARRRDVRVGGWRVSGAGARRRCPRLRFAWPAYSATNVGAVAGRRRPRVCARRRRPRPLCTERARLAESERPTLWMHRGRRGHWDSNSNVQRAFKRTHPRRWHRRGPCSRWSTMSRRLGRHRQPGRGGASPPTSGRSRCAKVIVDDVLNTPSRCSRTASPGGEQHGGVRRGPRRSAAAQHRGTVYTATPDWAAARLRVRRHGFGSTPFQTFRVSAE